MQKNNLIATKNVLPRGWRVSFKINPFGVINDISNILHATIDKDRGKDGERTPGIWFHKGTTKLRICSAVNGNPNYCYTSLPLALHKESEIVVEQVQSLDDYKYYYQIFINGKRVKNTLNVKPQIFKNVKYYASNPWHIPAKAILTEFKLVTYEHKSKPLYI